MENETLLKVKMIRYKGNKYILVEDVADLIKYFGSTEETDVRNRADELANNVLNMKIIKMGFDK